MSISRIFKQGACLLCAASLFAGAAQAQSVYRTVGADGKVTYSDRQEAAAGNNSSSAAPAAAAAPAAELPYDLREVAQRFPVTLYTGDNCTPCASARNLLLQRGVPFAERTVNSDADIEALRRLSGTNSLPYGTVGAQQLLGFSQDQWTLYLDTAGYPKKSNLPANYRNSAAVALVALKTVNAVPQEPSRASATRPLPARPAALRSGPTPSNPAGIQF